MNILRGIAAAGTVLGGAVATQTTVYANDAVEKKVEANQTLAKDFLRKQKHDIIKLWIKQSIKWCTI